ncbi:MAG: hypothetical protein IKZ34_04115 [Alphaproteobacteria bacterium]|nr:hypothetical protein [Alphaproteobacteria bacterium]
MNEQKVNVTNTSPRVTAFCMVFVLMFVFCSMLTQELILDKQKQHQEQAKKQYTLDSLRYVQDSIIHQDMLRFQNEFKKIMAQQQYKDSLLNMAALELGRDVRARTKQSEKVLKFAEQNVKQR